MPVLVTGTETAAGRAAVRALVRTGGEVRAWLDDRRATEDDVAALRALRVKIARGELDDEGRLELALEQVHTVVHLGTSLLDDPDAVLDDVASLVSAALGAGCRRFVLASSLHAGEPGGNPWLEAVAEAEQLLADAPLESVVLRTALRYGRDDPLLAALAHEVPAAAAAALHAPLFVDDLADAVVVLDRERGGGPDLNLVVPLVGPDVLALSAFAGGLPARLRATAPPPLPAAAADVLARDGTGPPEALGRSTGTRLAAALPLLA